MSKTQSKASKVTSGASSRSKVASEEAELSRLEDELDLKEAEVKDIRNLYETLMSKTEELQRQLASNQVPKAQVPEATNVIDGILKTAASAIPIIGPLLSLF